MNMVFFFFFFFYRSSIKIPQIQTPENIPLIILKGVTIYFVILWYQFANAITGRGSSIGSEFAWHASSPEFVPHVQHILSWRLGHENISTAILPLPLIQEEQLSVTGERMCTKYW